MIRGLSGHKDFPWTGVLEIVQSKVLAQSRWHRTGHRPKADVEPFGAWHRGIDADRRYCVNFYRKVERRKSQSTSPRDCGRWNTTLFGKVFSNVSRHPRFASFTMCQRSLQKCHKKGNHLAGCHSCQASDRSLQSGRASRLPGKVNARKPPRLRRPCRKTGTDAAASRGIPVPLRHLRRPCPQSRHASGTGTS
jgi:hypothetical protein